MKRSSCIVSMVSALVCLSCTTDSIAEPTMIQTPAPNPNANPPIEVYYQWTETASGSNVWNLEVWDSPAGVPEVSFTVRPSSSTPTVILDTVRIHGPGLNNNDPNEPRDITVTLGVLSPPGQTVQSADRIEVVDTAGGRAEVFGHLTGTLGEVRNANYVNVQVNGNVVGPIDCVMHPTSTNENDIQIYSNGNFTGSLIRMRSVGGSPPTLGEIHALEFPFGDIGTESWPVSILADGFIEGIYTRNLHARIGGTNANPASPDFDSFVEVIGGITTTAATSGDGKFTGELRAERLDRGPDAKVGPTLEFGGVVTARMWFQELVQVGDDATHIKMLAGNLTNGCVALSTLSPGGDPLEIWGAHVNFVDQITSPPDPNNPAHIIFTDDDAEGYTPERFASALGGGAVGRVPFLPHSYDFNPSFPDFAPLPQALAQNDPRTDKPITIRYLGPVRLPASGRAFTVQARLLDSTHDWFDATGDFPESLNAPGTAVELTLGHTMPGGYEYRVSPSAVLLCDLPTDAGLPDTPVVGFPDDPPFDFYFRICDDVPWGDADFDGVVRFEDVTAVLTNWGHTGHFLIGDADKSDVVNFADITKVLTNFNHTYCGATAQSLLAKADGFATMDLDQDAPMSASDAAGVITAALIQMG